jgi:hypothetical protein
MLHIQHASRREHIENGRSIREHLSRRDLSRFPKAGMRRNVIELLREGTPGAFGLSCPSSMHECQYRHLRFFVAQLESWLLVCRCYRTPDRSCSFAVMLTCRTSVPFETPDGRIVFDLNDFDETIPGPWEWDIKRMATSLLLAGLESEHGHSVCLTAAEEFIRTYCNYIRELSTQPILVAARNQLRRLSSNLAIGPALQQAKRATPQELLKKYTVRNGRGQTVFSESDRLWRVGSREAQPVLAALRFYRKTLAPNCCHFFDFLSVRDIAFKIVGTGGIGLRDYVVLMEGNGRNDPLFLQLKQEVQSAYRRLLQHAPCYRHSGRVLPKGSVASSPFPIYCLVGLACTVATISSAN